LLVKALCLGADSEEKDEAGYVVSSPCDFLSYGSKEIIHEVSYNGYNNLKLM